MKNLKHLPNKSNSTNNSIKDLKKKEEIIMKISKIKNEKNQYYFIKEVQNIYIFNFIFYVNAFWGKKNSQKNQI